MTSPILLSTSEKASQFRSQSPSKGNIVQFVGNHQNHKKYPLSQGENSLGKELRGKV